MRRMPAIGIFFLIIGVLNFVNGAWMLLNARTWYEALPGVVDTGPYNGHFVRDIGLAYTISGVGFVWCAFNLRRCWPIIVAQALWAGGHALLHVADMFTGRMSASHWLMDAPGVLIPGVVIGAIALPQVWRIVNPLAKESP